MRSQFAMHVDEHLEIEDNPRGSFSLVFANLSAFTNEFCCSMILATGSPEFTNVRKRSRHRLIFVCSDSTVLLVGFQWIVMYVGSPKMYCVK
jgi:hypothetical protein